MLGEDARERIGGPARRVRHVKHAEHPLEAARRQLDDVMPLLTGDPMTVAADLGQANAEREELENLPKKKLLRRVARSLAADVSIVGDALLRQPEIIIKRPGEVAVLV
jgi:hypothetical protein